MMATTAMSQALYFSTGLESQDQYYHYGTPNNTFTVSSAFIVLFSGTAFASVFVVFPRFSMQMKDLGLLHGPRLEAYEFIL